jgi:hypothetical protein
LQGTVSGSLYAESVPLSLLLKYQTRSTLQQHKMTTYYVSLVAVSGREQPVLLRVRREGICLYSLDDRVSAGCHLQVSQQLQGPPTTVAVSGMQELQRLPFPHIVKWIPSNLRSREPGDNECLDIQIETVSGRKDLRMRCHSQEAVQNIMADIRGTVNVSLTHPEQQMLWY